MKFRGWSSFWNRGNLKKRLLGCARRAQRAKAPSIVGALLLANAFGLLNSCAQAETPKQIAYALGPDDEVVIRVQDLDEFPEKPYRIDRQGYLHLPVAGRVNATGLTLEQLELEVAAKLKAFLKAPAVSASIEKYREQPVSVLGAVAAPGVKQIHSPKHLLQILSEAGGMRADAGSRVTVSRPVENGPLPLPGAKLDPAGRFWAGSARLAPLLAGQNAAENIPILPHDVITVPRADFVYVLGDVARPGGFELSDQEGMSVLDALSKAGGPSRNANSGRARVLRVVDGKAERVETVVDLNRMLAGKQADVTLKAEDILYLPANRAKLVANRAIEAMVGAGTSLAVFKGSR